MEPQRPSAAEFVENLKIEVYGSGHLWEAGAGAALEEGRVRAPRAYVAAASVVAFTDGIPQQQKEDLLNSTLLAQLAANKQHDRERQTLEWYQVYRDVLVKLGWQPDLRRRPGRFGRDVDSGPALARDPNSIGDRTSFLFDRINVNQSRFTAAGAVLNRLNGRADQKTFGVTQAAIATLAGLPDRDRRSVIFETSSHSPGRGNFQIIAVTPVSETVMRMTMVAVYFVTTESVSRVLTFNFGNSSTQMFQSSDTLTLDSSAYAAVRDKVIAQLGAQAPAFIDEIILA